MYRYVEGSGTAARFQYITDLDILSPTELICTDPSSSCLRLVNFTQTSAVTSTFAGRCGDGRIADGSRLSTARFNHPASAELNSNRSSVFVTGNSDKLRVIDLETDDVTTIVTLSGGLKLGIKLLDDNIMYFLSEHKVTEFKLDTNEISVIAGGDSEGNATGSFQQTEFNHPFDALVWRDNEQVLLLVTDVLNNRFVKIYSLVKINFCACVESVYKFSWPTPLFLSQVLMYSQDINSQKHF